MMVQETRRTAPTAAAAPIANAIAVASGKGGVGKTWLSITLATRSATSAAAPC